MEEVVLQKPSSASGESLLLLNAIRLLAISAFRFDFTFVLCSPRLHEQLRTCRDRAADDSADERDERCCKRARVRRDRDRKQTSFNIWRASDRLCSGAVSPE